MSSGAGPQCFFLPAAKRCLDVVYSFERVACMSCHARNLASVYKASQSESKGNILQFTSRPVGIAGCEKARG